LIHDQNLAEILAFLCKSTYLQNIPFNGCAVVANLLGFCVAWLKVSFYNVEANLK